MIPIPKPKNKKLCEEGLCEKRNGLRNKATALFETKEVCDYCFWKLKKIKKKEGKIKND